LTELLVSAVATFVAAPFVRQFMLRQGVVDVPNHRSSHSVPTPRGGGLACLIGIVAAAIVAQVMGRPMPWVFVAGAVVLSVVGFADDRLGLSPLPRLAAQFAVGALMGSALGGGWWFLAAVLVVPLSVNVVNFMDGINGITSLTIACWGVTALLVGNADRIPTLALIGAVTAGASLGFLPWNAPVARIFLGDVGSYLLGGLVASGTLIGIANGASSALLLAPMTLFAVDTGTVLARRAKRGSPLFEAHREHIYQRLVGESGLPHFAVALSIAGLSALLTIMWSVAEGWIALAATAAVIAVYVISPRAIKRLTNSVRNRALSM